MPNRLSDNSRRIIRYAYFIIWDIISVIVAAFIPLVIRFGIFTMDMNYVHLEMKCLGIDIVIFIACNAFFRLYNRIWTYASLPEMGACVASACASECIFVAYKLVCNLGMPKSYYPINWMVLCMMLCATRISIRVIRRFKLRRINMDNSIRVMIFGAGAAGNALLREMQFGNGNYKPICLIDDNPNKKNNSIQGVTVVGNRHDIQHMVDKYAINEIIIAIPSAKPTELRDIVEICQKTKCKVRRLSAIATTLSGSLTKALRDINYEDLLGRDTVVIRNDELGEFLQDKVVMVTGGGGSIGSEICRQIAANHPRKLIIVDIYENSTYELARELETYYPEAQFQTLIASVRDADRMEEIFKTHQPDVVYHAAAHKHVPLMEDSPNEAIKNNCLGTLNIVRLADKYKVKRFVLISTDKAVRPTNVMGATKRICEMIIQTWDRKSKTEYVAVRFGNVLGSNGSVIPLFLKQIEHGGPITLTHRDITRYFMTIPEAVSLVLAAGMMAQGGEIFVLDMGEPVKIYDLACQLIRMKGLKPEEDIKIDVVGLRPGEKLYEELLMNEEGLQDTANNRIKIGKPIEISNEFEKQLDELIDQAEKNTKNIRPTLSEIVPTYQSKVKYV